MEARVTRLEEWAKLADRRMGRVEDKLDGITAALADLRAHMVGRSDLESRFARQTSTLWAAAGAIVGALALLFTAYQAIAPKPPASGSPPQPIVIQLPPAPAPIAAGAGRAAPHGR